MNTPCNHPHHQVLVIAMPPEIATRLLSAAKTVLDKIDQEKPELSPAQQEEIAALRRDVKTVQRALNQILPIIAARRARLN